MSKKKNETDMSTVNRKNMETYIEFRKRYAELKDKGETKETNKEMKQYFDICEHFIVDVINKDKMYYTKLSGYKFSNEDLQYCM